MRLLFLPFLPFAGFRAGAGPRRPLLLLSLLLGLALRPEGAHATHIRAGDIQARADTTAANNERRVFFRLTLYTDATQFNQEFVTIYFGDGTRQDNIPRTDYRGGPRSAGTTVPNLPDTKINLYFFEHVFPAAGTYTVSFVGENRTAAVLNMANPVNTTFYINQRITIDPALRRNSSPVLLAPAIDRAGTQQVFLHNPAAYDADGDSLSFKKVVCRQVDGGTTAANRDNTPRPIPCDNYRFLDAMPGVQVAYNGNPPGTPGATPPIYDLNARNGQITWNAPLNPGDYNIAFIVEEWRRAPRAQPRLIGQVVRDMQIVVRATDNLRPSLTLPADLCVEAGQTVTGVVTATDGAANGSQQPSAVRLFAYGGMLPPATFTPTATGPSSARGTFIWSTSCQDVGELPRQVLFKVQDTPGGITPPLIDQRVWNITVVGPRPRNLVAAASPTASGQALLTWDRYVCQNATNIYIYRKEGPGTAPGACVTGIPASSGYTRIASVTAATTSFIDNNLDASGVARGLDRGKTYCYRIYADFPLPAGGASLASDEACVTLPGQSARLTMVDVTETDAANGKIQVRWTRPSGGPAGFGTPSGYRLSRGEGRRPASFSLVRTFTSLNDTAYLDTGLNTRDGQYAYQLDFFYTNPSGNPVTETAAPASSVFVTPTPDVANNRINLTWTYQTPWDNSRQPVAIFRRTGTTGAFTRIGTAPTGATGGNYADNDPALRRFQTYTYYVRTDGQYAPTGGYSSLPNRSQQAAASLTISPCTPVLTLAATNCDSLANLPEFPRRGQRYTNALRWQPGNQPAGCGDTIRSYNVFFRPEPTGPFTLLGTTTQTSYSHQNLDSPGGCYAVQAVDLRGTLSDTSNVVCQEFCVFFSLPNIFTPNGDGLNDTFRPKTSSPLRQVRFQAFNRWGVKVFENITTSPTYINWDGGGPAGERTSSAKVADGVYYYLAEVEFADAANTTRTYKGWVEIMR